MQTPLSLRYVGPAVDAGEMDAYEAGASIMAFGDFLGVVSQAAYGDKAKVRTTVRAVRPGSFEIEFAVQAAGIAATIFSSGLGPKDILELIKQSFAVWKLLQGEPPKRFAMEDNRLVVENNYGTINYFRLEVGKIVANEKAGEAVERFVKKNLERGVDRIEIAHEQERIADATKEDAKAFITVAATVPFSENEVEIGLVVESPVFKEGNMWKFFDGQTSFHASIDDLEFLSRVDSGDERFGKGDVLLVRLLTRQSRTLSSLKTERHIVKVLSHKTFRQENLFGP